MSVNVNLQQQENIYIEDGLLRLLDQENTEIISQRNLQEALIIQHTSDEKGFRHCGKLNREEVLDLHEKGILNLVRSGLLERYNLAKKFDLRTKKNVILRAQSNLLQEDSNAQRGGATMNSLELLARKSDRLGNDYLDGRMLRAAHQLFEDYEIGEVANTAVYNYSNETWQAMLASFLNAKMDDEKAEARKRFAEVMHYLGNGLCDVVYRVCCLQEGLETAEIKLGWSARSAKVVLRIALIRVADFYQIPQSYKERKR